MCGCGDCLGRDNPFDASDTNKEDKKTAADFFRETKAAVFETDAGNVSGKKRPAILA